MAEESLGKSMQLVEWLARQVGGVRLGGDLRTRVAAICFGIAQEHHAAIVTLLALATPLSSSAFALGRPQFEAYVRGMWLAHCATDEQVEGYLRGKIPDMASLIAALEKLQGDGEVSSLRTIYRRSWRAMSGMTHTGAEHLERWSDGEVLEPAFKSDDTSRRALGCSAPRALPCCPTTQISLAAPAGRVARADAGALESQLGKFEAQADRALLKIDADRTLDDTEAWIHVLNLAALFAVRHPLQRENVRQFMERTSKIVLDMALSTPERWAAQLRQARAAGAISADTDVPYKQLREFHRRGEYTIEVPTARHIDIEFKTHDTVLHTLVDRQWTLCIAQPGAGHFMTSDHLLALMHSDGTPSMMRPVGHGLTGTTVFFPINRELFAVGTF